MNELAQQLSQLPPLCKQALGKWTGRTQEDKACEECGELIAAIHHVRDGREFNMNAADEAADVVIMGVQMLLRFTQTSDIAAAVLQRKMNRLAGILGSGQADTEGT